jgi:tetratricopeptide (TPR) repeat protein
MENNAQKIAVGIIAENDFGSLITTIEEAKKLTGIVFVLKTASASIGSIASLADSGITILTSSVQDGETAQKDELIEQIEQRNAADFLLWMNPGDRFDATTFAEFKAFTEEELDCESLYMMVERRLFRENGKRHDFDEENISPRLMPLRKGLRHKKQYGENQHRSSLIENANTLMIRINAAPGRIVRFGGAVEIEHRKAQAEKIIDAINSAADGDALLARAEAFLTLGRFLEARKDYQQLIETATRTDLKLSAYYGLWETVVNAPMPSNDITKFLVGSLDVFPVDMQLLTWMGAHLQSIGKLDLAVRAYETALKFGKVSLDVWHRLHIREIALTRLALVHRLLGHPLEAMDVMENGLKEIEDTSELSRYLLDLYIAEEEEPKALELAGMIWGDAELDKMRNVIYGACRGTAGSWVEAAGYVEKAYQDSCRDVLCLRWYSLALLSTRRFTSAIDILKEWLAVEPDNQEARSFLAAAHRPERFSETIGKIRDTQLKALGVAPDALDKKPHKKAASVEKAVREMILSSGGLGGGKIVSTFGKSRS